MGRYYNGDIEGKFWFGVQPSDDADHFGVSGEATELNYYFEKEHIPTIKKQIAQCKRELGANYKILTDFFKKNNGYNDEMILEQTPIKQEEIHHLVGLLARLDLGEKILKCVKKSGECCFTAEL